MSSERTFVPQQGAVFDEFSFRIEASKVDELCFALRERSAEYRDLAIARAAGHQGIPVPPTFLNSSIQAGITGVNPVDLMGISRKRALHAGQEYEYLQPIHVGDVLTGRTTLTEVREKTGRSGRLRFLTLETVFRRNGVDVAVVRNRVVERLGTEGV
jgi:acyl dehydratase